MACSPPVLWPQLIDGLGPLRRQDRLGLSLAVCVRDAGQRWWARRQVAAASSHRGRDGPRARRLAALRAGAALTRPRRGRGAGD
jgi:hypothetical protein